MDGTELRTRWPQWRAGADVVGLYQAESGILNFVGAGHAAKFAGLIGHILADLAIDGPTDYPIAAFSIDRPAVRDPGFPSDFRFSRATQAPPGAGTGRLRPGILMSSQVLGRSARMDRTCGRCPAAARSGGLVPWRTISSSATAFCSM